MGFHEAFLPYYTLVGVVGAATFVSPVRRALESVALAVHFPAVPTGLGWPGEGGTVHLAPFAHPGALLLYACGLTVLLYRVRGKEVPDWGRVGRRVLRQGLPTSVAILLLVAVATVMASGGMTFLLARGLVAVVGPAFPLVSPLVGLLGTVVTGSNTNSNVLFGALQRDAARLLGMDPVLMAALQTSGGSLGSMVAPAKVVLATATVGLTGHEGQVMRLTVRYALAMTLSLGAVGLLLAWL
jgi:lactate permease